MKMGIIGAGAMTLRFLNSVKNKVENVFFTAVCDKSQNQLDEFNKQHPEIKAYTNLSKMLSDADIDAVYICTPVFTHKALTTQAANSGKHILCEKPMALNIAECEEMIRTCDENGVILQIGYMMRFHPTFEIRWLSKNVDCVDWSLRTRSNLVKDESLPQRFHIYPNVYHTQREIIPHEIYYKKHPEFFALIDGKRSQSPKCKLCNSNPLLPAEIARRLAEMIKDNPGIDWISLSPTDFQNWCQCEACKAMDEPNVPHDQKYSRRQMILYNRVAEESEKYYPDQKILVGAYNVYTWPPKNPNIKGHRNLAVVITHYYPFCLMHPVNDETCELNKRYIELINAWKKHTSQICFYEYYWKADWLDLRWPVVHCIKEDIPFFKKMGIKGLYTQHSRTTDWSTMPAHYIASKLLWDHTADVNELLEDFYNKFYGRVAEPMEKYHELLENQMANCGYHTGGFALKYAKYVFTPEVFL